ncbi:MAG: hypothetical protein U0637_04700 [Phycisphaerales bacterium]
MARTSPHPEVDGLRADQTVCRDETGRWLNKCDRDEAPSRHDSLEDAVRAAQFQLRHHTGGFLIILDEQGTPVSRQAFAYEGPWRER